MSEAFITLATTDEYCLGALNLANSLKRVKTTKKIVIMITETVTEPMRNVLGNVFDEMIKVDVLDSNDHVNLKLLARPDLGVTFTKLHCWRLTHYSKAVFMDADTLVLHNIDDLFEREELSAAPDPGWPDCFNSGVFVFQPSQETYKALLEFSMTQGSFDGGDQGLLNLFFNDWSTKDIKRHLPFVYNCVSQVFYSYLPAFVQYRQDVKVIHFIGSTKPWHYTFDESSGAVVLKEGLNQNQSFEHLQKWWSIFAMDTKPLLSENMTGLCAEMASLNVSRFDHSITQPNWQPEDHQQAWEHGIIDYRGIDSFANIQAHLDSKLSGNKK